MKNLISLSNISSAFISSSISPSRFVPSSFSPSWFIPSSFFSRAMILRAMILRAMILRAMILRAMILVSFTISIGLYSCSDEKLKKSDSLLINPVANPSVAIEEIKKQPLLEATEKFKGEFIAGFDQDLKTVIRTDPDKPGLLAVSLFANTNTEGAVYYWYDPSKDVLSSKKVDGQKKFSILSLDQSGNTLTEIYYDWERNTSDTTIYNRK